MLKQKATWALAVFSAVLFAMASPGFITPFLSLVFLLPFVPLLKKSSIRDAFMLGAIQGSVAYGIANYWLFSAFVSIYQMGFIVAAVIFVLAVILLYGLPCGFLYAAMAWAMQRGSRPSGGIMTGALVSLGKALALGMLWAAMEYFRGMIFPRLNITTVGSFFYEYPRIIAPVGLIGEHLSSGIVIAMNYALYRVTSPLISPEDHEVGWPGRIAPVAGSVMILVILYVPALVVDPPPAETPAGLDRSAIMMVQAAIPAEKKWKSEFYAEILERYIAMTGENLRAGTRFVLWPETAVNFYLQLPGELRDRLTEYSRQEGITIFTGGPEFTGTEGSYRYYNAIFRVALGVVHLVYRKERLIPFAEYCPVDFLYPLFRVIIGDTQYSSFAGNSPAAAGTLSMGMAICFESTFPDIMRARARGADILVVFSDDIWLGEGAGPKQHLATQVLRAVENRRWLICCVNSGISAVISPGGNIIGMLPFGKEGVLHFP